MIICRCFGIAHRRPLIVGFSRSAAPRPNARNIVMGSNDMNREVGVNLFGARPCAVGRGRREQATPIPSRRLATCARFASARPPRPAGFATIRQCLSADSWPTPCPRQPAAEFGKSGRRQVPDWTATAVKHIVHSPLPRRRRVLSLPLRRAGQDIRDRESRLRQRTPTPARGNPLGDRRQPGLGARST